MISKQMRLIETCSLAMIKWTPAGLTDAISFFYDTEQQLHQQLHTKVKMCNKICNFAIFYRSCTERDEHHCNIYR